MKNTGYKVHDQYLRDIDECNTNDPKRKSVFITDYKEKGFCDIDLWCLATTTAKFVLPRLIEFRDKVVKNGSQNYRSIEDYNAMIYSFQKIVNNDHMYVKEEERNKILKGLVMFSEQLTGMWC